MRIIEVEDNKVKDLAEHIEKSLRHMGKAMQCIEELEERGGRMGERWDERGMMDRGSYGNRDGYGNRGDFGERWDDYGNRRGGRGRY